MEKTDKHQRQELDKYQSEILKYNDSNILLIAGAGSGKTFTLISKINYLIENKICDEKNILVISFTNASVQDLKNKIKYNIDIFTFHKLANFILTKINFNYSLAYDGLLKYIVGERIKSADINEQKYILKFLKINSNYDKFLNSKLFDSFCNTIVTFINLYKTNNLNKGYIFKIRYSNIEKKILIIVFEIYYKYILEKKSSGKLDFDDLIITSTAKVKNVHFDYKYIIIDEFQDTSFIRFNLIREIQKKSNSYLIVIGDDWQSIYGFSGCNLHIFLDFEKYFHNTRKILLKNTYRNSIELIKIASAFITKNPYQIKKQLSSLKSNTNPIVFMPYTSIKNSLKKILDYLLKIDTDIMVLYRNNKDILLYIDNDFELNDNYIIYKGFKIKSYTVHKSKGLEANYVIVINCNNELLGFPNQIENNVLINKLLPNTEYPFAEERRLFYVAITRCKIATYLLYQKNNPSIFIKEMKKISKKILKKINYFN